MTENNYFPNLRKIKNKDALKLAGILVKNSKALRPHLAKISEKDANTTEIGLDMILDVAPSLGKEGYALLIDLTGLTQDEFEDLPIDSTFVLFEKIKEENDIDAFFGAVSKLAKSFPAKGSAQTKQSTSAMTLLQPATDGQSE